MNEKTLLYVQSQLARSKERLRPYVFVPGSTFSYPGRYAQIKIKDYIDKFLGSQGAVPSRWVIMPGLSGTGKTTILAQLFFQYFDRFQHNRVLYVSLDEVVSVLDSSLQEVLQTYEQILGKSFEEDQPPILLFIDEVHRDPKWASVLTSLYNRSRNVMVICSGSSAVSLQINFNDLGRRAVFEKLYPLNFGEFMMIKKNKFPAAGLKQGIKEAIYGSSSAKEVFSKLEQLKPTVLNYWSNVDKLEIDNFLTVGTLPYAAKVKDRAQVFQGIDRLLDKIINQDITDLGRFDSTTIGSIKRLLFLMADGDALSINATSSDLQVNTITLGNVIDAIEKSELIIKIPAHGSNSKKARRPAKFLFMSPAIRMTLLDVAGLEGTFISRKGKLLEDVAVLHFYREFIAPRKGSVSYDSAAGGADFLLQLEDERRIAFEIGIGEKDGRQIRATMDKIKCNFGIVVCQRAVPTLIEEDIVGLPLEYFLSM